MEVCLSVSFGVYRLVCFVEGRFLGKVRLWFLQFFLSLQSQ